MSSSRTCHYCGSRIWELQHVQQLARDDVYDVTGHSGACGAQGRHGNQLASRASWSFSAPRPWSKGWCRPRQPCRQGPRWTGSHSLLGDARHGGPQERSLALRYQLDEPRLLRQERLFREKISAGFGECYFHIECVACVYLCLYPHGGEINKSTNKQNWHRYIIHAGKLLITITAGKEE